MSYVWAGFKDVLVSTIDSEDEVVDGGHELVIVVGTPLYAGV